MESDDDDLESPVSEGKIADSREIVERAFSSEILSKFEIFSYRNAAGILSSGFPKQYDELISALERFSISTEMIRMPGGSKGPIAKYVDTLFDTSWIETRISADLHVRLRTVKGDATLKQYVREGFLDGHRMDFVKGRVALDVEWNSKDQTYDRDLYAFSAFYNAGAIDAGIIITRGNSLDNAFFRSLGMVLKKDGSEGDAPVYKKFGASTTWMGKLLYRLDAGRNGGCPILAVGITPKCVADYSVR